MLVSSTYKSITIWLLGCFGQSAMEWMKREVCMQTRATSAAVTSGQFNSPIFVVSSVMLLMIHYYTLNIMPIIINYA